MNDWKTCKQLTSELGCSASTITRMASLGQLERRKIRDGEHEKLGCSPLARIVFRHVEPREVSPLEYTLNTQDEKNFQKRLA